MGYRFILANKQLTVCERFICRMSTSEDAGVVLMDKVNNKGLITLNRPKALNSLNLEMVRMIHPKIKQWQSEKVDFMLIKGAGPKAFCAGGDVVAITRPDCDLPSTFFGEEYALDYEIGTSTTPWIAIINGVTMGGGVGLSVHGRFRIATENTLFAMPETAIGLIPDVGGGYFLPRLAGELGTFLALTGYRLRGRDVLHAGIATHLINTELLEQLESELLNLVSPTESDIDAVLNLYHNKSSTSKNNEFSLNPHIKEIDSIFSADSIEAIIENLEKSASQWSNKQLSLLSKMSPTSLKLTLRHLREGRHMDLREVFIMEYRIGCRCLEKPDFKEGVRALLVDRDNSPKWMPSKLSDVSQSDVDYYFKSLPKDKELVL